MCRFLRRHDGPPQLAPRDLFPTAADWLLRSHRLRARDRLARCRFVCAARLSRLGAAGGAARSLDVCSSAVMLRAAGSLCLESAPQNLGTTWEPSGRIPIGAMLTKGPKSRTLQRLAFACGSFNWTNEMTFPSGSRTW